MPYAGSPAAFFTLLFLSLFLLFFYFGSAVPYTPLSIFFRFWSAVADSSLITIPCMLLRGKYRTLALPVPFVIAFLLIANLLYFRNFNDMIPPSLYRLEGIADPTVTTSARSSLEFPDIILAIAPFIPVFHMLAFRKKGVLGKTFPKRAFLSFAGISLLAWGITTAGAVRRQRLFPESAGDESHPSAQFIRSWSYYCHSRNFTGYAAKILTSIRGVRISLDAEDIRDIRERFQYKSREGDAPEVPAGLRPRNLIFIVVESLPFRVLETDANAAAPVLSRLAADSAAIVGKCKVLAGYGRPSDAQFIYNTGLLPLRTEPFVTNYSHNDYPSLAKALGCGSLEVIGEDKDLWSHSATSASYGFGRLVSGLAPDAINQDSIILDRAFREISRSREGCFMFVTTLSMHNSYLERAVSRPSPLPLPPGRDERDIEYLYRLNHFDRALGRFISRLKAAGEFDGTLIVIAGDHEISKADISPWLQDDSVPLIIINSPLECTGNTLALTQLDVFPSILDMAGVSGYRFFGVGYRGLGNSIFRSRRTEITEKDYRISEMIIKNIR